MQRRRRLLKKLQYLTERSPARQHRGDTRRDLVPGRLSAEEAINRVGQKGGHTYIWAKVGSRPPMIRDNRHDSAYIFGAICPDRAVGAAIIAPLPPKPNA
jgi:hypothetical protein